MFDVLPRSVQRVSEFLAKARPGRVGIIYMVSVTGPVVRRKHGDESVFQLRSLGEPHTLPARHGVPQSKSECS